MVHQDHQAILDLLGQLDQLANRDLPDQPATLEQPACQDRSGRRARRDLTDITVGLDRRVARDKLARPDTLDQLDKLAMEVTLDRLVLRVLPVHPAPQVAPVPQDTLVEWDKLEPLEWRDRRVYRVQWVILAVQEPPVFLEQLE
jgi:hypothetical protein